MPAGPVKVLYVLGFGRSGSTLLDILLGELPGFFSAGELQSLWRESLIDGRLCGCGVPVAECALWSEILGGPRCTQLGMSPEERAALQADRLRLPRLGPRIRARGRCKAEWRAYAGVLGNLYHRIAEVTHARVIVDSSKLPSVTRALEKLDSIDLYYIHLVRDARAVAFSWMRSKEATDRTRRSQMERLGPVRSSATWLVRGLAADRIMDRSGHPSLLLRYEDLVATPTETVARVAALVNEPEPDTGFIVGTSVKLAANHTVSGNPIRLMEGPVEVREDAEWRTGLVAVPRAAITATTWPLLRRYDYV